MPELVRLGFLHISACPLCGTGSDSVGRLSRGHYLFGATHVEYPRQGFVPLRRCRKCELVYKEYLPNRSDLVSLFRKWNPGIWMSRRTGDSVEARLGRTFRPREDRLDILDIGGADGAALQPLENLTGRRSVLDIVEYPGVREAISGELILGFIEEDLAWSHDPYDVVLAFDLMEHLYDPSKALDNIAEFVGKEGVLIVQTANATQALLECKGQLDEWWYLNLFEHHIAWPYETLVSEMKKRGFVVAHAEFGKHKQWHYAGRGKKTMVRFLKAFQDMRIARALAERLLHVDPRQLSDPGKADHMTIVFRRPD